MAKSAAVEVTGESEDVLQLVGRSWGWVFFFGIVSVILGVLITVHPEDTVYAIAILLGVWLCVAGLFRIVMAIADSDNTGGTRVLLGVLGVLSVIIGVFFLRHTFKTAIALGFLIGLFWIIGGSIEFFTAYERKGQPGRGWRIFMGALGFVAGVVTLVIPGFTLVVLTTLMGIWIGVYGILQIITAFQIRKLLT